MGEAQALSGGFSDPVMEGQAVFRAVMTAMAEPGIARPIAVSGDRGDIQVPSPLSPEAAMVMLTLCDADTPIWLDRRLAASDALLQWIAFHCGAPVTAEPMDAHFAFVSDATHMSPLGTFCCGTQDYPDRSTTIVVQIEDLSGGGSLRIAGPGIDGSREWSPHPLPRGFAIEWASNHARFPRGVDLVMVAPGKLAAMPRSTRILAAGSPV